MAVIQVVYCCHSGLLRPSWWSRIALFWAVSLAPRMTVDGSPGSRWINRKARTEMMNDTTTSWMNRRRRYLPMESGWLNRWPGGDQVSQIWVGTKMPSL